MQFKGDITVKRTGVFDRRADQGLRAASISTSETLTRHSAAWQDLAATSSNDLVVLPEPSTGALPEGWTVVIRNTGDVALDVETQDSSTAVTTIAVDEAVRITLTDNSDDDGEWFVEPMQDAGEAVATRYTLTHDATTSWGSASGGYYSIATTASTHGRGTRPMVQFYETVGSDEIEVTPDRSLFTTSAGDHTFRTVEDPDLRYAGKVIFV